MAEHTPVVFRRWPGDDGIIALFPTLPASQPGSGLVLCYAHIGQHGSADYGLVIRKTKRVDINDRNVLDLIEELESLGYSLKIMQRRPK